MSNTTKIVVLGAGYAGVLTAKQLEKKLKKNTSVEITIIDKNAYHTMLTELHEVAANRVSETAIRMDLKKIFAGRKVDVIIDEIGTIDYDNKKLVGKSKSYGFDYLVVGTGCKPTYFGVKGAKENSFPLWSFNDAVKIKEHILQSFRLASNEPDQSKRLKLLSFIVVGAGFTGVEMVGELAEWKKRLCADYNISEKEVTITVADVIPKILHMFNDKLINKAAKHLTKLGVNILVNSNITEITPNGVVIDDKKSIEANTVIWAAGVESSDFAANADFQKAARNRIETDEFLEAKGKKNVYVVGDNIYYIPEGESKPVPQMVENAEHSSSTAAHNIAADINKTKKKSYKPEFHGAMVCIGGRYGVAQVGLPGKMFGFSGFLALFMKHFINLIYFVQVLGFNKIWSYLVHEIFDVKDNRSLVGGFLSKRSPNFWLVPLRLFVGVKWLLEGWEKLQKVLDDPNNIFLIPSKIVVSGASEAADGAAEAVNYGTPLAVPDFIADLVSKSMDMFFYTPTGEFTALATVFQTGMVVAEILVGLALIGGLFTALASIVSIMMGGMIWSSGMAPTEMLWYMIAAVALIGGSGSTFGLDYWVLPFLKKQWKKIPFVKKWYIYID